MNNGKIKRKDITDFISANLAFLHETFHISKIGLFGSFSREEENDASDIDIIIEFDGEIDDIYELKEQIRAFFRNRFGCEVDIAREKYLKSRVRDHIHRDVIYVS